jgi:hypothetical protein
MYCFPPIPPLLFSEWLPRTPPRLSPPFFYVFSAVAAYTTAAITAIFLVVCCWHGCCIHHSSYHRDFFGCLVPTPENFLTGQIRE